MYQKPLTKEAAARLEAALAEYPEIRGMSYLEFMAWRREKWPTPRRRSRYVTVRTCDHCGKPSNCLSAKRKFCTDACKQASYRERKGLRHGFGNADGSPALVRPVLDVSSMTIEQIVSAMRSK